MARRTDPDAATVKLVRERDDWRCARCAGWGPLSTQHRVARGMGGSRLEAINLPSNLLTLCGSGTTGCHGWVEHHPRWAQAHGWSVPRWQDPAEVAVWTWRGWVWLRGETWQVVPDHKGIRGCECGCRSIAARAGLWEQPVSI